MCIRDSNPDPHNVTSITDGTGATPVVNQYDSSDRVKKQIEGPQILDFVYGNLMTTVTQTLKNSSGVTIQTRNTIYQFDAGGYLTKITDPQGNETRYTFDGNRDITRTELWEKPVSYTHLDVYKRQPLQEIILIIWEKNI